MGEKVLQSLDLQFNIFTEGREYTGNHRSYVLENAKKICNSPATMERIKLREAVGYYGHGKRILAGKMDLSEVEAVTMPDGSKVIVSNIPSNVTTAFAIGDDGTVSHTQEILENETGQIVASLNDSKVGGFSWACPGRDGGAVGATRITGFSGFDYVIKPGFSMNRGYVLESADGETINRDQILESIVTATGLDDKRVEALFDSWSAQAQLKAFDLEAQLEAAEIYESALLDKMTGREREFNDLDEQFKGVNVSLEEVQAALEQEKVLRKDLVDFIAKSSPFFIPESVQHAMMENDFSTAQPIFESAKKIDFNQVPVGDKAVVDEPIAKKEDRYDGSGGWDLNN